MRDFFIGDFNGGMEIEEVKEFYNLYGLISLNDKPTCYKNHANPSCIYLMLTNCSKFFHSTIIIKRGLFVINKMAVAIMKINFHTLEPKIVHDEKFQEFYKGTFQRKSIQMIKFSIGFAKIVERC